MNYILIMTEGSDELAFINVLLDKGIFKFKREELLMEDIYHARQITGELIGYIQLLQNGDVVSIYRVGDKLSDKLTIPKNIITDKIVAKYDISTTPEFEVLFLLNEGIYEERLKCISFDDYSSELDNFELLYIPWLAIINNPTVEDLKALI